MRTFTFVTPVLLGLFAAALPWEPLTWLNRLTESSLQRRELLGERQLGQRYGPHERHAADVYQPPANLVRPAGGWPLVVFFYGGSWRSGACADYAFVGRSLAARGAVVVAAVATAIDPPAPAFGQCM